jgi:type II secretory pathway component PulF
MFMPSITLPDFKRLIDWCAWRLPITHTVQRDRGMAETCALLASAIRGGVPLPEALTQALSLPLNEGFRQRLDAFRRLILAGTAPADAARTAELPDLMAGLLAPTTARAPDAQLFTFLERYYRNRFSRTLMLLRGAIEPFLVLCLATLVGTTVLSLFLPLVKLIASVTFGRDGGAL